MTGPAQAEAERQEREYEETQAMRADYYKLEARVQLLAKALLSLRERALSISPAEITDIVDTALQEAGQTIA